MRRAACRARALVGCRASRFEHYASSIARRRRASSFVHASCVEQTTSVNGCSLSIARRASCIRRRASSVARRASHVVYCLASASCVGCRAPRIEPVRLSRVECRADSTAKRRQITLIVVILHVVHRSKFITYYINQFQCTKDITSHGQQNLGN
jgi:hypothetical protein